MLNKQKKYADDGWAIWVDGDDTSTVYINDWINPKGKSYVDLAIRIRGIQASKCLHVYVPFALSKEEMQDVSLLFEDKKILQAIFSAACIIEYKKNEHTSEIAYNGKTVDIVHISTLEYEMSSLSDGTHIIVDLEGLKPFLDNDEGYFIWRMPHKSLDEVFRVHTDVRKIMGRLRDLITTPIVSEKYGYSIRVNEARRLPDEITCIGAFHRQKLKKAVITLSISEDYELNDVGCFRIHRMEENLYEDYLPNDFSAEDVITYQWNQSREYNLQGHFNFYNSIVKSAISKASMCLYIVILLGIGIVGDLLFELVKKLIGMG